MFFFFELFDEERGSERGASRYTHKKKTDLKDDTIQTWLKYFLLTVSRNKKKVVNETDKTISLC